ncbi:MAG: sulfite exporter TauE/SafE family protein [Clostridia bacterium]|nr:sulfite exporter TauE/SafE family protein [Clostridia bacterium]
MNGYIISVLAGFLAGVAGAMGLGGGSVLLIYLTVFAGVEQLSAQGINLIFFIPIALTAVIIYSRKGIIKFKQIIPIIIAGMFASITVGYFVKFLDTGLLRKIFGGFVLVYGIIQLFTKNKTENKSNDRAG